MDERLCEPRSVPGVRRDLALESGCEQEESREHAREKHRSFHLESNNETGFWFSAL